MQNMELTDAQKTFCSVHGFVASVMDGHTNRFVAWLSSRPQEDHESIDRRDGWLYSAGAGTMLDAVIVWHRDGVWSVSVREKGYQRIRERTVARGLSSKAAFRLALRELAEREARGWLCVTRADG